MALKSKKEKKAKREINLEYGFKLYQPKYIKERYLVYGVPYVAQNVLLTYVAACGITIGFGALFELNPLWIVMLTIGALLVVPVYLLSIPKSEYEVRRLTEVSSYMSQMVQSMIDCKSIYPALLQISKVTAEGEMKDTVDRAIKHIEVSNAWDKAQIEALSIIEKKYPCVQLKRLHDFCIRAQDYGGDFTRELHLIDNYTKRWEKRAQAYQIALKETSKEVVFEYMGIMLLCAFILRCLPDQLSIIHEPKVQMVSALLIVGLFVYLLFMQNKICSNLLVEKKHMSMKEVETAKAYIVGFKTSRSKKAATKYGIISLVTTTIMALLQGSSTIFIIGLVLSGIFFNMHNIILHATQKQIRVELEEAFPRWLFDLCLLAQKQNISVAITESVKSAPPIFQLELQKFQEILKENPETGVKEAYLGFLKEYQMDNVLKSMQMLLSLHIGYAVGQQIQMEKLIDYNMELLDQRDSLDDKRKKTMLYVYHFLPLLPAMLVSLSYMMVMIDVGFSELGHYMTW